MSIEESTNKIVLSVISYLDLDDDEFAENLHKDIAIALQAERNQALEEAITVVSNAALKNELAQRIRDLK